MKIVKLTETTQCPDLTTPPGVYLYQGMIYVAPGNGMYPIGTNVGQIKIDDQAAAGGGLSEDLAVRLVAAALRPDLVANKAL